MVGQIAGVDISQSNGGPGTPLDIHIRGTGSITAGNSPLYVVDGFPLHVEVLSTPNTNDISSIEILKDASATAIYGSRGSNGVVIITTRRGNSGKPKIEVSAYTGIQQLSKKVDVLNADEYVELAIEATQNAWVDRGGRASDPNSARPALYQIAPYFLTPDKYKVGRSYGYCHHDVEDLMQETFIHAYENLKKLNNKEYFKSWLIRIMLNECYSLQYTNFNCRMAENMGAILKKIIE